MHKQLILLALLASVAACASSSDTIPGTKVPKTDANKQIIKTLEAYRLAVERGDAEALVLMAAPGYWEDGGTPGGQDDYGYAQLKSVLTGRFRKAQEIRYSLRYVNVAKRCPAGSSGNRGCRAYVDVLIDASYSVPDARGKMVREDKQDQNQIVLIWDQRSSKWKILSGM